ncbi:poly(beta-D-mannuronate) lyase [Rhizobium sp. PP-F2F-G38]|nr:poly(beta-D-mannuronate) lyase [Rhizobium sp. PP-F2F-G38]
MALVLTLSGMARPAFANDLVPPPGYYSEVRHNSRLVRPCTPSPVPFTEALDFPSKYEGSGKSRNILNEVSSERYKTLTKPISDMEKGAVKLVDQYMDGGSTQTLQCVVAWYGAWADAKALLGPAVNHTGKSERKWALASLSGAWLRLKFSRSQPLLVYASKAAEIDDWLGAIADQATREWDKDDAREKINNHYYWAAWSVMATSIVTNRRDQFDWAKEMYAIFAEQVDADGFLPNELKRQTRAADYQVYAVTPAAMMAAFGKVNNVDLAGEGHDALHRAVERAVTAYDNPRPFAAKTGTRQVPVEPEEKKSKLAWLEPYCWTVRCTGVAAAKRTQLRPLRDTRLGGNMTATFAGR